MLSETVLPFHVPRAWSLEKISRDYVALQDLSAAGGFLYGRKSKRPLSTFEGMSSQRSTGSNEVSLPA